jgi:uncharacterized protein YdeI (YjbR/CyaY-like superfamily)
MDAEVRAGHPRVSKQQAIEVALCHGWIDGQLNRDVDKFCGSSVLEGQRDWRLASLPP